MSSFLIFLYFIAFPFGQLLRKTFLFSGFDITLNASDFFAGLIFLYTLFLKEDKSKLFKIFSKFVFAAAFSFILSIFIFKTPLVAVGFLYLVRLLIYLYMLQFSYSLIKSRPEMRNLLFNSLIILSLAVSIFGWIQYFIYPDLTALKYVGWDDHLFRLVGTFLDPGYTSLIIVLGAILVFFKYVKEKRKLSIFLILFLLLSLAFTYSRAGYLALIIGFFVAGFLTKKFKLLIFLVLLFLGLVYFLPKPRGEGVNLARTYDISLRFQNYSDTLKIFAKSPLFGVGFNNICLAKSLYLGETDTDSHSCSGSDSSLLLILATSGICGFLIFLFCLYKAFKLLPKSFYTNVLLSSSSALFIHSLLVNSLFYPWIMAYFAILASLVEV